ncbi:MAG: transglutaminase domain-containing protein [Clostridia bacterium]|nr:transglutaminase domain-containing protein [Clostridia bacterium]
MNIDLSYLSYPLPTDIQMLYDSGRFTEMNRLIQVNLEKSLVPDLLRERLLYASIAAEDVVNAYRLTRAEALQKARTHIPDLSDAEWQQLTDERTLDWRFIEGEVRYRNNCVSNLLKTRPEFAAREKELATVHSRQAQADSLNSIIKTIQENGNVRVHSELRESITINSNSLTPGEPLRVWLPLPVAHAPIVSWHLLSTSHDPVQIADAHVKQPTVYFELPYEPGMTISTALAWDTEMPYVKMDQRMVTGALPSADVSPEDLAELEPHIRFTPYLKALTREIIGEEVHPLRRARRIYDFITRQCTYRFMPSYRSIPDIPGYFASNMRGDCGVQALTFITMCRIAGIPARWQSGLYTSPLDSGMHDWAQFYIAPYGWRFADCSFGGSAYRAGDLPRHDFYFGHLDPWRLPFASAFQQAFEPANAFMRYDPYDNQVGEVESLHGRVNINDLDHTHTLLKSEIIS